VSSSRATVHIVEDWEWGDLQETGKGRSLSGTDNIKQSVLFEFLKNAKNQEFHTQT
jgi:hypothetical protein